MGLGSGASCDILEVCVSLSRSWIPVAILALEEPNMTIISYCLWEILSNACSTINTYASVCPGWNIADILYPWMAKSESNHGEGVDCRCRHWCSNLEAFRNQHIQRHLFWKGLPIW